MIEPNQTVGGRCLCGAVQIEVTGPSLWRAICYCESCCRAVGAPAVAWVCFGKSQLSVVSGALARYESSPGVLRGFCQNCGTSLTYERQPREGVSGLNARPDEIFVTTLALDDPTAYPPEEHIRYGERVEWFQVADDLPCHEGLSPTQGFRQHQAGSSE